MTLFTLGALKYGTFFSRLWMIITDMVVPTDTTRIISLACVRSLLTCPKLT